MIFVVANILQDMTTDTEIDAFVGRQISAGLDFTGSQTIEVEHLVAGAIAVSPSAIPFRMTVLQKLHLTVPEQLSAESEIPFSPAVKRLLQCAIDEADQLDHHRIRPEHCCWQCWQNLCLRPASCAKRVSNARC